MTVNCAVYRETQMLLALKQRLAKDDLTEDERRRIEAEITRLEEALDLT